MFVRNRENCFMNSKSRSQAQLCSTNDLRVRALGGGKKARISDIQFNMVVNSKNTAKFSTRKYKLIEIILYSIFLITFTLMSLLQSPKEVFYYNSILQKLFLSHKFLSTSTVKDFWEVITSGHSYRNGEFSLFNNFYWEEYYAPPNSYSRNFGSVKSLEPDELKLGILYENQVLGLPRLHQIRVKSVTCPVKSYRNVLPSLARECFPEYSTSHEERGDKNGHWPGYNEILNNPQYPTPPQIFNAWVYKSEPDALNHWGRLTTYAPGGANINLGRRKADTLGLIQYLLNNGWVTRSTRAVFLDFTLYNANLNIFSIVRFVWEFHVSGDVIPSHSFKTVRLIQYVTFEEFYIVFPCEIAFCLFTIYYSVQAFFMCFGLGIRSYLSKFWSFIDISILLMSYGCITLKLFHKLLLEEILHELVADKNTYYDFQPIAFWSQQLERMIAVNLFLIWIKLCKYLAYNDTIKQFSSTLSRCATDIGGFATMFFIVFFAFAQTGHLLFGAQLGSFSTYAKSCLTLMSIIIGEFDFRAIEQANRILGPIYFLAFIFFVFLVLVNMFIAIVNDTYIEVKGEIEETRHDIDIVKLAKKSQKQNHSRKEMINENYSNLAAADGKVTNDEIAEYLQRCGFSDAEIELFLSKLNIDPDIGLDAEEANTLIEALEATTSLSIVSPGNQNIDINSKRNSTSIDGGVQTEKYHELQKQVQYMESIYQENIGTLSEMTGLVKKDIKLFEKLKDNYETHAFD